MAAPENTKTTAPAAVPAAIPHDVMQMFGATQSPAMQIFLNDALYARCKDVARIMAAAEGVTPAHLINKPEACFSVVSMSLIWKLAPTMVAGSTFSVGNKIGYEGKLIQAILENSGKIEGTPTPEYFGDWSKVMGKFRKAKNDRGKEYAVQTWKDEDEEGLGVIVRGQVIGEATPREFEFHLKQAFPRNSTIWATDPKTQLWYTAVRRFANVAAPGILMGVPFSREEALMGEGGELIDVTPDDAQPARPARPSRAAAKKAEKAMDEEFKSTVGPAAGETIIEEDDSGSHEQESTEPAPADDVSRDALVETGSGVVDDAGAGGGAEGEDFKTDSADDVVVPEPEEEAPPPPPPPAPPKAAPKAQEAKPAPAAPKASPAQQSAPAAPPAPAAAITEVQAKEIQKKAEQGFLNAMTLTKLDEVKAEHMPDILKLKVPFPDRYENVVKAFKGRGEYLRKRASEQE